jgi:hypothetical protein
MRRIVLALTVALVAGVQAAGAEEHPGLEIELKSSGEVVSVRSGNMMGSTDKTMTGVVLGAVTVYHVVKPDTGRHCFVAQQWLPGKGTSAQIACRQASDNARLVLYFVKDPASEGELSRVEVNDRDDTSPWGYSPVKTTHVFMTGASHRCWWVNQGGQLTYVCPPPVGGEDH